MQGQKCTRIDLRACLFSKISWGSMPPDPPSAVGTLISPPPSNFLFHIFALPFLNFLNANPPLTLSLLCLYKQLYRPMLHKLFYLFVFYMQLLIWIYLVPAIFDLPYSRITCTFLPCTLIALEWSLCLADRLRTRVSKSQKVMYTPMVAVTTGACSCCTVVYG